MFIGLLACSAGISLLAQSSQHSSELDSPEAFPILRYELELSASHGDQGSPHSEVIPFPDSISYGFLGLSAFTLDTQNRGKLSWRYRSEGKWSEWQGLATPVHGQPHQRQSWQADPLKQDIDAWQLKSSDSLEKPLVVRLFYAPPKKKAPTPRPYPTISPKEPEEDSCACPPPPICKRLCWCPGGNCSPPSYASHLPSHFIIHHSAGFTDYHDYPWVVAYYWDLHVNTNGWSDIGYNWLIDPDGVVYQGRGARHVGAHFSCMNGQTSGIALIGNYMTERPSAEAQSSLVNLLAFLSCKYSINPTDSSLHGSSQLILDHISGHRDANAANRGCPSGTVCPGDSLYPLLDQIQKRTAQQGCLLSDLHQHQASRIELYPQPTRNWLKLKGLRGTARTGGLFDLRGQQVQSIRVSPGEPEIFVGELAPGWYQLRLQDPGIEQAFLFQVAP